MPGPLRLILDSDAAQFGGHARTDASITYPVSEDGMLSIYAPSRTALVYG